MSNTTEADEHFLRRAIRLAMNGRGRVEPNPMVGCVLVKDDRVIGEGFHGVFGGPHAEPAALANCTESPEGATAYVTLEPCCHTNKKTAPCAPRLIEAKVARVVIGCLDPNPDVNGKSVRMLREAGIDVAGPMLEAPAKQLIAMFRANLLGRPYVTAKWAQTADGKVAGPRGVRRQISGLGATRLVHDLRARSTAMLVGVNTVLNDDPLLTARGASTESHLDQTIVLDTHLRTPPTAKLFQRTAGGDVVIYCSNEAPMEREHRLEDAGATVRRMTIDESGRPSIREVLNGLGAAHVLAETGPTRARAMFAAGAIDRLWVIESADEMDEPGAPDAAGVPASFVKTGELDLAGDVLSEYLNPDSPVFYAPEPSADLVLGSRNA